MVHKKIFVPDDVAKLARAFVPGKHFLPGLIFITDDEAG
jgi:hypothetical protein